MPHIHVRKPFWCQSGPSVATFGTMVTSGHAFLYHISRGIVGVIVTHLLDGIQGIKPLTLTAEDGRPRLSVSTLSNELGIKTSM